MKFMVLLLAIWAGLWLIKRNQARRALRRKPAPQAQTRLSAPQPMVACAHCGMHAPVQECVSGHGKSYCSQVHRQEAEAMR